MTKSVANIIIELDTFIKKNNKFLFVLIIALIIIRFFWLNYSNWQTGDISNGLHGVKHWLDTDRYINGADKLLNGSALVGREMQFIGYMLIIAFTKLINLPIESLVVIQLLFALVSALALFDISRKITNSKFAGLVAAGLYLCNPFVVSWHMYILTESLYTSFVILSLWCLIQLIETKKLKHLAYSIPVLILTILIRPNGWILIPVWVIFLVIRIPKQRKWKWFF